MPELSLKRSDTLHTQIRYIEHVHEEVSCQLFRFWQNGYLSNLAVLYDLCIDNAYAGKSTCTTAFGEQSHTLHT